LVLGVGRHRLESGENAISGRLGRPIADVLSLGAQFIEAIKNLPASLCEAMTIDLTHGVPSQEQHVCMEVARLARTLHSVVDIQNARPDDPALQPLKVDPRRCAVT
jgi:hypothetical protein